MRNIIPEGLHKEEKLVIGCQGLKEACKLLEVGFEYVADMGGKKLFRKRK